MDTKGLRGTNENLNNRVNKLQKKTSCCSCVYYSDYGWCGFCRLGLAWRLIESTISFCSNYRPLVETRCGTCKFFRLPSKNDRLGGYCSNPDKKYHFRDMRNYFDCCAYYQKQEGKDLKPNLEPIPPFFLNYFHK